ncbi:dipeptide epimerase [Sphingobium boeckii]|uniref:Dipeptide epimerase n=1 Tax=Sphingobium boeckii TaxID=1082345 RepID=A0A7W9AFV7_9SPHN|nr:dipeptide epimerase [Sphingobium boeckii]MBB5684762.1 L-alanine-DL-glutamate epimerase-like enolase superfamily enzyme [Sphingobium boeckii]
MNASKPMVIEARAKTYALKRPFRIASSLYVDAPVVEVTVRHDGVAGRGEAAGVDYVGENCAIMLEQIQQVASQIDATTRPSRAWLKPLLPPGGARNALDCALWDLEAKHSGVRAHDLVGQSGDGIVTHITIGLDTPEVMAKDALSFGERALIKIKLGSENTRDCLRAVRAAAPTAQIIVDANQSWTFEQLLAMEGDLLANGVTLVEQPLAADADDGLLDYTGPLRLCADESSHDRSSLAALAGKYSVINIKLDKTGGLTEAMALADAASAKGFGLMVGCMGGSSLGIAPALIVAAKCEIVDLDCPLQLRQDIAHGLHFSGHRISGPSPSLWG